MTIDQELIESLYGDVTAELHFLMDAHQGDENALHFDASSLVPILAWQILVPFLISFTSKVVADRFTARRVREKTASQLRTEALTLIGRSVKLNDPDAQEESVILVHELLASLGVDREGARKVVSVLAARVKDAGSSRGR